MSLLDTIEALHAELDAHPEAHDTRLILADALEEAGGAWAALSPGYRALAAMRLWPQLEHGTWAYFSGIECSFRDEVPECHRLPADWFSADSPENYYWTDDFSTRQASEDRAALAFSRLPAARRAELLAPVSEAAP